MQTMTNEDTAILQRTELSIIAATFVYRDADRADASIMRNAQRTPDCTLAWVSDEQSNWTQVRG